MTKLLTTRYGPAIHGFTLLVGDNIRQSLGTLMQLSKVESAPKAIEISTLWRDMRYGLPIVGSLGMQRMSSLGVTLPV